MPDSKKKKTTFSIQYEIWVFGVIIKKALNSNLGNLKWFSTQATSSRTGSFRSESPVFLGMFRTQSCKSRCLRVTDAGGWVVVTLVVDGGNWKGEGSENILSGVETLWLATAAARGEIGYSLPIIGSAANVSSAPSCPWGLTATSLGFATNLVAQRFTFANCRSFGSIADGESPGVPEAFTPDAHANQLDLACSSICDGTLLRRLEGPETSSDWSYIGN